MFRMLQEAAVMPPGPSLRHIFLAALSPPGFWHHAWHTASMWLNEYQLCKLNGKQPPPEPQGNPAVPGWLKDMGEFPSYTKTGLFLLCLEYICQQSGSSGLASRVTEGPSEGALGTLGCTSLETSVLQGLVHFIWFAFNGSSQISLGFLSEGSLETSLPVLHFNMRGPTLLTERH